MSQKKKYLVFGLGAVLLAVVVCIAMFLLGIIRINTPSLGDFPVRGVDVSEYQGNIDWNIIEQQNIRFAFIRATEGSGYTDQTFAANWEDIAGTSILAGAYHFFSFDSPAKSQAANFIATVSNDRPMLPPVVDVELYGEHKQDPPDADIVRQELDEMLRLLEENYGAKPILYSTAKAYRLYLSGHYAEYPVWIRDVYFAPDLPDGRQWVFWQYSDKGRLEGYGGEERFIDLNVYAGSLDDLKQTQTGTLDKSQPSGQQRK